MNRVTNFNLLRCKLHVKVVLNGNGFHYGRAIVDYQPLHTTDSFTRNRLDYRQDVVEASQRPHIYLDPTKSQGGTLILPLIIPANAIDIPEQTWDTVGQLVIRSLQDLKHANGAADSVTVTVFAWATDVVLSVPTANEPGDLAPQAGEYTPSDIQYQPQAGDEYGKGPISRPASIIARAAGALTSAPTIGLYARATQLAASAVSAIATSFGFSRPVLINDVVSNKPYVMGNVANTNVPDTSTKLSLDVKQELCCDTRTFGLDGTDEMTIRSVATRESYLTSFGWLMSDPTESLLWNTEVSPITWAEVNIAGVTEYHMPACCFATIPFKNWRGTMKYRFQIVCSAYHKGRLKIVYDPSYPVTNEYNTNYTYIIDIAKTRDFTMEIGWGQQYPYVGTRIMGVDTMPYSETPLGGDPSIKANGILSVYVVNELTTPSDTVINNIQVNVFIAAGDDFEVANPASFPMDSLTWFQPQAGEYDPNNIYVSQAGELGSQQPDADDTPTESIPIQPNAHMMGATVDSTDNTNAVFFGEAITSWRQCLKRYNYHSSFFFQTPGTLLKQTHGDFPFYKGWAPGAIHSAYNATAVPTPHNYGKMTLLNWVTPAYLCRRGGIRWKYLADIPHADNMSIAMSVNRNVGPTSVCQRTILSPPAMSATESTKTAFDAIHCDTLWSGGLVTSVAQNPVLEFELPFMSHERFQPARFANQTATPLTHYHNFEGRALGTGWPTTEYVGVKAYVSTAEDYTLGFYMGAPPAFVYSAPTPVNV